jgi:hypothetical protein
MKNLKNNISIIVMTLLMILSLSLNAQDKLRPEQFDYVGQQHNAGLDEFYNIISNTSNKNLSKEQVLHMLDDYLKSKVKDSNLKRANESIINGLVDKVISYDFYNKKNFLMSFELSSDLKERLTELYDIIANSKDLASLNSSIVKFNEHASNAKLTNEELSVLYGASSTAKYSAEYWSKNMGKWSTSLSESKQAKGFWGSLWEGVKKNC